MTASPDNRLAWPLDEPADGPLHAVRVIDCSRLLPVSYGSQMLADLGASVLKLEPPGGEYGRAMHAEFAMTNRGKGSVELDLAAADDREAFLALVAAADVVLESFRPGVMDRLGLGYSVLSAVNPALIVCSVTGYGQKGDEQNVPGHDLNFWSVAGGVQVTPDRPPTVFPVPVADMATGIMSAFLVTSAVVQQRASGVGTHLDLGMADVCLSMNTLSAARAWNRDIHGDEPGHDARLEDLPWPALLYAECPCYGTYQTADGSYVSLGNVEPKFWANFLREIGRPDLEGDRLATGERAVVVRAEIQRLLAGRTRQEWMRRFEGADACVSPVNTIDEARTASLFADRGMTWDDGAGMTHIGFPATFDGVRPGRSGNVPAAGADNARASSRVCEPMDRHGVARTAR